MHEPHHLFVTCPRGVEDLLAAEISAAGGSGVRVSRSGVACRARLETAYRLCLWSRVGSRVLLRVSQADAADADALYSAALAIPWERHLSADTTFAVDLTQSASGITHTKYGALKVKDAVADRFREREGRRPSVDVATPDVRVNVSVRGKRATFAVDLSGAALHRRGYRREGVQADAPLKESLAAAVLLLAGWPRISAEGGSLVDPLCGSGTLPIEAALMAGDVAPGLLRTRWGFEGWLGHDPETWATLLEDARARRERGRERIPRLFGYDRDVRVLRLAEDAAERAGVGESTTFAAAELSGLHAPAAVRPGLLVANPPYGERLGSREEAAGLHRLLAERWREGFPSWRLALITADAALAAEAGIEPGGAVSDLMNGPIPVVVAWSDSPSAVPRGRPQRGAGAEAGHVAISPGEAEARAAEGVGAFANRLRKNARHIAKWARREGVSCYRVYDADLPDFSFAVDLYQGAGADEGGRWAHVAEYAPPASVDPELAAARLRAAVPAVAEVLGVAVPDVFVKVRTRQRGASQYERRGTSGRFRTVAEGGSLFLVNLEDYLDTGLFLDHRPTRLMVRERAEGKHVLNLFGYTGSFSVHAAAGGAASTLTVDMSAAYTGWARENLELNGFGPPGHEVVREDALVWLSERTAGSAASGFDIVVLDPPSFSNSAKMEGTLDVQRDHAGLLRDAAGMLSPGGVVLFSNNLRSFRIDASALAEAGLAFREITAATIPPDFARNPRVHTAWLVWPSGSEPSAWSAE